MLVVGLAAAVLVPVLSGVAVAAWLWATTDVPPPGSVRPPQASVLRYAGGEQLARLAVEDRTSVELEDVSLAARRAVLAAEDRDFYDSGGVSWTGMLRAALVNLRSGEIEQGGSTITQQYARAAFLTQERTWSRKAREVVLAAKLARERSKDDVLERYLNTVYFGRGAHGIQAAARTFFGVPASELTAAQGAVLAAQLAAPSAYDPERAPGQALDRFVYVVRGMAEQGWLEVPVEAVGYPEVLPRRDDRGTFRGPQGYLVQTALDELEALGFPQDEVEVAGLSVETTFDASAQAAAVRAVEEVTGTQVPPHVYRALASVEPGSGRVRALYGGRDHPSRPLNAATQGRALAGSSFKTYVLAAALSDGIPLRTRYDGSSPQSFGDYEVKNYGRGDGAQYGRTDLVEATAQSVNTVYVPLGLDVGTQRVAEVARSLGITSDLGREQDLPSLSLGVSAVTPLEQAVAYATIAAGGLHAPPYVVERVRGRDGEVLYEAAPSPERVLDEAVAADVTAALQEVVADGTGTAARLPDRAAAGKTGTTTDNTAAWFVGYTPRLATAVALYTERQDQSLTGIAGVAEVTGGSLPARVWGAYTAAVTSGLEPLPFPERADVGAEPSPATTTAPPQRDEPRRPARETAREAPAPAPADEPRQEPAEQPAEEPAPAPGGGEGPAPAGEPTREPTREPTGEPSEDPDLLPLPEEPAPEPEP
ncbi:MAG TPA: transglycosylase domain-containing protein, partial [Mycobacteriales bacterium]|nr:transglycosylase domain-containing protein [Mycobacteriales bacterium]